MECKLQLGGRPEIVDAIKLASVAIETLVELGGALDVLSIAHVECPNCGTRFSRHSRPASERDAARLSLSRLGSSGRDCHQ